MNILFISFGLYPCKVGGVEIFNYHLIDRLRRNGHKTHVITYCNKETRLRSNIYVIKNPKFLPRKLTIPILSLLRIFQIRKKIDIIHAPYTATAWFFGFFLPISKILWGKPYVLMIHGGGMHEWGISYVRKLLFKEASAIIAVSETMRREYEKRTNREVLLMPNLIPAPNSSKTKKELKHQYRLEFGLTFLYVGTLKSLKGIEILIDAYIELGSEFINNNNLKLIVIGRGPLKKDMIRKIEAVNLDRNVHFLGFVEEEIKYDYLKLADVFVIPSIVEAQSISSLDAMSNGLAIIGSDIHGISNVICDGVNGLLFRVGDAKDLRDKLKILVDNETLRLRLGKNAANHFQQQFNYEKWLSKMVSIYNSV
jgi:glycosyltransferase involved in cell wall biosynthesis